MSEPRTSPEAATKRTLSRFRLGVSDHPSVYGCAALKRSLLRTGVSSTVVLTESGARLNAAIASKCAVLRRFRRERRPSLNMHCDAKKSLLTVTNLAPAAPGSEANKVTRLDDADGHSPTGLRKLVLVRRSVAETARRMQAR
jgi:hypothetical protein